ncbi:hypothetical protein CTI12_AA239530 [Artemisia annua]|uniref:Uncharacterized protein n=1 Tax=Artemisia annua TaxID=35608 RepID=A0A2U1NQ39_ARTAN|nr:hypothetical protein CTI12_AA239530 [Artemisia annua]
MSANNKRSAQWVEGEGSSQSASKKKAAKSVKKLNGMEMHGTIGGLLKERKQQKRAIKQYAEDEKEFDSENDEKEYKATKKPSLKQHPKAYKTLDDDDLSDVEFDGWDTKMHMWHLTRRNLQN